MTGLSIVVYTLSCLFGLASHESASGNESVHAVWVPKHCGSLRYPPLALAANIQGAVLLEIKVNGSGRLRVARAVQGSPLLFKAAIDNVKTCEFTRSTEVKLFSNEPFVVYLFEIGDVCKSATGHCPTDLTYVAPGIIRVHTTAMPVMPGAAGESVGPSAVPTEPWRPRPTPRISARSTPIMPTHS
jgi:hypothetical protein